MSETGKLKEIDLQSGSFTANGKTYFIEKQISTARWKYYVMFQSEVGFGVAFADMLKCWQSVMEDANKLQFANIVITANNQIKAIGGFGERKHPAMAICALFCNTEGEDRKTITEQQLNDKLKDFEAEGIDVFSFFTLAAILVSGLNDAWNDIFQTDELPVAEPKASKRKI